MANVILPILHYFALGGTMNMMNYDNYKEQPPIFSDTDFVVVEYPPVLNASYYILQDDRLPYDAMGLPIDLVLRLREYYLHPKRISYNVPLFVKSDPVHDVAAVVMTIEFTTGKQRISPYAEPVPGWQELVPESATHYAEEVTFGRKCLVKVEVGSSIKGDIQIIKRILAEAMRSSGHFTNKDIPGFIELWKFALNAAKESPDVRGNVYVNNFYVSCPAIDLPFQVTQRFEDFLAHLRNILIPRPDFSQSPEEETILSVSLKPLHNLDDRYPPMEIKKQSEEYLSSLHIKLEDLKRVLMNGYSIPQSEEQKKIKGDLWGKVNDLRQELHSLITKQISIYKDIDVEKFDDVFQQYKAGLDKGDANYFSAWKKHLETFEMKCSDRFRKPTPGVLLATEDEVANIRSRKESLQSCRKLCRNEEHCRAVGYDENNPKMCRIYSVSTNTAVIFYPGEDNSMKIYDRYCEKD